MSVVCERKGRGIVSQTRYLFVSNKNKLAQVSRNVFCSLPNEQDPI